MKEMTTLEWLLLGGFLWLAFSLESPAAARLGIGYYGHH
jgi:hypothetical protein